MPVLPRLAFGARLPDSAGADHLWISSRGVNDLHARLIGQWLSERLGQQFVIENRTGAGGSIAAEAVVRSPADGYTLLLASASDSLERQSVRQSQLDPRDRPGKRDLSLRRHAWS